MAKVEKVTHKGKVIVLIDLCNAAPEDTVRVLPEAQKIISSLPPKSVLVLTDVSGAVYSKPVAEAIKTFVNGNTPFTRASAVVGAEGVRQVLLQTVIFLTRREIKTFNQREQALEWLAHL